MFVYLWFLSVTVVVYSASVTNDANSTNTSTTPKPQYGENKSSLIVGMNDDEDLSLLKPEYHHPKGAEAFDPYNTKHKLGKSEEEEDEEDEDYYFDSKKSNEKESFDNHDLLPSIDGDHLHGGNDNLPIFLLEPQNSYVIKNKPAKLSCQAANALQVYFKCNGVDPASSQFEFVDPQSGVRIVEAECNVTYTQVEEYFGEDRFKCNCYAWTSRERIQSRPAYVEIAYLRKQFALTPHSTSVPLDGQGSLRCRPPSAAPPAKVYWLKDNTPLVADDNILVSDDGHLLFSQAALKDMANYSCVAENIAGKRVSEPALLTVYVDGGWSQWSVWQDCKCGTGRRKTRTCTNPQPLNGGAQCIGNSVQRTADCLPCQSAVPGRWSPWSPWSNCGRDCKQRRQRSCIGETSCTGRDVQYAVCSGGFCGMPVDDDARSDGGHSDHIPLYIGMLVALLMFAGVACFIYVVLKKKKRQLYSRTRDEYNREYFLEGEKTSCLQPDLTQHSRPPCYEHPSYQRTTQNNQSEHYYDVPQLTNSYSTPADHQTTPCTSAESDEYELKPYNSGRSYSSGMNSTGSGYSAATDKVNIPTTQLADLVGDSQWTIARSVSGSGSGVNLLLKDAEVSLTIPDGACMRRTRFHLAVLREERHRPNLPEGVTQLSPVVKCGPIDIPLSKPAILEMPHCADLKCGTWEIAVYSTDCRGQDARPKWRKVVTLGQETIDTPVYTQLDLAKVFLVTDYLSTFVLVGESKGGQASKNVKLLIFGPPISNVNRNEYSVRIYALDDTPSAVLQCEEREKRLGGLLLDEPRSIIIKDSGEPLCFVMEKFEPGWTSNNGNNDTYQEIPFDLLWSSSSNVAYFTLRINDTETSKIEFTISARQQGGTLNCQTFYVKLNNDSCETAPKYRTNITENPFESRTLPLYNNDNIDRKITRSLKSEGNTVDEECGWKLPKDVRTALCDALDPPGNGGAADWRSLAAALGVSRYPQYWAARLSPADHVLALWEARHRLDPEAPRYLARLLHALDRHDLAQLIEDCLPPDR